MSSLQLRIVELEREKEELDGHYTAIRDVGYELSGEHA